MLGFLEHLVAKRLTRRVLYSRLPTGHGHSDIDGCFAIIWDKVKLIHVNTMEEYAQAIKDAFTKRGLIVNVVDVEAVLDYTTIYEAHVDDKLGKAYTLVQTQHQWLFEAVVAQPLFPFGVKTMYRAYSANRVVEFTRKPPSECFTRVGRLTGMEPYTAHVCWHPAKDSIENRSGVEGFYLLHSLPQVRPSEMHSKFTGFKEQSASTCLKALKEVQSYFRTQCEVLDAWATWYEQCAPKTDCVDDYVSAMRASLSAQSRYHKLFPLKSFYLLKPSHIVEDIDHWITSVPDGADSIVDPGFQWPALLAACMPCVATRHTPNPPEPRLFVLQHAELQDLGRRYEEATLTTYESTSFTNIILQKWLTLKVDASNRPFAISGRKVDLVRKLNAGNTQMAVSLFNPLPPETIREAMLAVDREGNAPFGGVISPELGINFEVGRSDVRAFVKRQVMSESIIDALMLMLQIRYHSQAVAWHTRTGDRVDKKTKTSAYKPLPRDLFFTFGFRPSDINEFLSANSIDKPALLGVICLPVQYTEPTEEQLCWAAIVLDAQQRKLYLVDPIQRCPSFKRAEFRVAMSPLLDGLGMAGVKFEEDIYMKQFCCIGRALEISRTSNLSTYYLYETGLYLIVTLIFIVTNTPIYFTEADVLFEDRIANKIVSWIKIGGKLSF